MIWCRHRLADQTIIEWLSLAFLFLNVSGFFPMSTVFDSLKYLSFRFFSFADSYWCEQHKKEMRRERTTLKHVTFLMLVVLYWQVCVCVCVMLNRTWCMCSITHICKNLKQSRNYVEQNKRSKSLPTMTIVMIIMWITNVGIFLRKKTMFQLFFLLFFNSKVTSVVLLSSIVNRHLYTYKKKKSPID